MGAEKIVSASSSGTSVRVPVALEAGSRVLQVGQRPPASDTFPPQFGHFIANGRCQGRIPARFALLRLCGRVRKYQSPKGFLSTDNVMDGRTERAPGEPDIR